MLIPGVGAVETLSVSGNRLPLGVRADVGYSSKLVELAPSDRVLIFSDGLAETLTSRGEPLGYEALMELLSREMILPAEWLDLLFSRLREAGSEDLDDDWTGLLLDISQD